MLKKTMTYTDFDGNERTEDFYFNLSKAEILEMEMGVSGGMSEMLTKIVNSQDNKQIVDTFKQILLQSYGERSSDGRGFTKSKELSDAFSQTEAYSNLFIELATNAESAKIFINGILPQSSKK